MYAHPEDIPADYRRGSLCLGCIERLGQSKAECKERHTLDLVTELTLTTLLGRTMNQRDSDGIPVPYAPIAGTGRAS